VGRCRIGQLLDCCIHAVFALRAGCIHLILMFVLMYVESHRHIDIVDIDTRATMRGIHCHGHSVRSSDRDAPPAAPLAQTTGR
jgi:hypothetical protein